MKVINEQYVYVHDIHYIGVKLIVVPHLHWIEIGRQNELLQQSEPLFSLNTTSIIYYL
jgi:hypothetical protein